MGAGIAATNDNGDGPLDVPLDKRVEYEGAPVRFFRRFSPPVHFLREYAFSVSLTRWLWHHAGDHDLIHVHAVFSYASTMAMCVARTKKVPYIVRPAGMLCRWPLQQGGLKKRFYLSLIERANLQNAAALHFMTREEKEESSSPGFSTPSFWR